MSIFHCVSCDLNIDSDFYEMFQVDNEDICEDCYLEQGRTK